jgi:hypothetical protein
LIDTFKEIVSTFGRDLELTVCSRDDVCITFKFSADGQIGALISPILN